MQVEAQGTIVMGGQRWLTAGRQRCFALGGRRDPHGGVGLALQKSKVFRMKMAGGHDELHQQQADGEPGAHPPPLPCRARPVVAPSAHAPSMTRSIMLLYNVRQATRPARTPFFPLGPPLRMVEMRGLDAHISGGTEVGMSATEPMLLRRDEGGVAWLTLNRPAQRNALSVELMTALQDAIDAIAEDRAVKVVVIAANGPGFCAGHDLREMRANPGRQHYEALFQQGSRLMTGMVRLPKPVIACVHGIAAAAGCQLVATCDLAVASSEARFAVNGINLGLFCSTPMVALTRAVGRKAAMEMLMTGDLVSAEHAKSIGLVNRVVAPERLDDE